MNLMKVHYGTRSLWEGEINLDYYGERVDLGDINAYDQAYKILRDLMNDTDYANDGHRNHDAVNSLIALHVMGYDAPSWMECWCDSQDAMVFYPGDIKLFMEHIERIAPYLTKWGPSGHEAEALNYII